MIMMMMLSIFFLSSAVQATMLSGGYFHDEVLDLSIGNTFQSEAHLVDDNQIITLKFRNNNASALLHELLLGTGARPGA